MWILNKFHRALGHEKIADTYFDRLVLWSRNMPVECVEKVIPKFKVMDICYAIEKIEEATSVTAFSNDHSSFRP